MSVAVQPGLDPQTAQLLHGLRLAGAAQLHTLGIQDARATYEQGIRIHSAAPPAIDRSVDVSVGCRAGTMRVRLYHPSRVRGARCALLIYFHGGGWSFGSIESHDDVCRTFCAHSRCIVASVDYRLSPEHKFPCAVDDAIDSIRWAATHALELGADPERLVIGGDSAGATLAAATTFAVRDSGGPAIYSQLLIYPATDMTMSYPSHARFGEGFRLTRPLMVWSAANYLRDGRDTLDPLASPLLAPDHSNLPKALIFTAGFDPLRDEGQAYAAKLRDAGVSVHYRCFEPLIHGFIGITGVVDAASRALDEMAFALRDATR